MYFKQYGVTYGVMPKNASSSFFEALRRHYQLPRKKGFEIVQDCTDLEKVAQPIGDAYFIVRHPLDRFESLWRSKCRDHHGSIGGHPVRDLTPEQLFDYIKTHGDPHWRSQTPYAATLDKEPTLVPIEHFAESLKATTGIEMWHQNPTNGVCEMSLELMDEVMDHYEQDVLLYERAVRRWELDHKD